MKVVFKIIMANKDDEAFFATVAEHFKSEQQVFSDMLNSSVLSEVLVAVRFLHTVIKHRAAFLLGDGTRDLIWKINFSGLIGALGLFSRFPWANILHNVVMGMITHVFQNDSAELIDQLLAANILHLIIKGLATDKPNGYAPHLRAIATAMGESQSPKVQEYLQNDALWVTYKESLEIRNDKTITFRNAEKQILNTLRKSLFEIYGDEFAPIPEHTPAPTTEKTETPAEPEKTETTTTEPTPEPVEEPAPVATGANSVPETPSEAEPQTEETKSEATTQESQETETTETAETTETTTEATADAPEEVTTEAATEATETEVAQEEAQVDQPSADTEQTEEKGDAQ